MVVPADVAAATIKRTMREYSADGELLAMREAEVYALRERVAELEREVEFLRDQMLPKARFQRV